MIFRTLFARIAKLLPGLMVVAMLVNVIRIAVVRRIMLDAICNHAYSNDRTIHFYDYLPKGVHTSLWYGMYQVSFYIFSSYKYLLLLWLAVILVQKIAYGQPLPNERAQTIVLASSLFYLYFQFVDVFYAYNLP